MFFNKGENCIAAGRLFVEESIHDEFLRRMVRSYLRNTTYSICYRCFELSSEPNVKAIYVYTIMLQMEYLYVTRYRILF